MCLTFFLYKNILFILLLFLHLLASILYFLFKSSLVVVCFSFIYLFINMFSTKQNNKKKKENKSQWKLSQNFA